MHLFILKKLISAFLYPFHVIIILLLLALFFLWFTKKQKTGKILVSFCFVLLIILGSGTVSNLILEPLESTYSKCEKSVISVKYIVVLGGGYGYDVNLPVISRLSTASIFRLAESIAAYRNNSGSKLIFTGYGGVKQKKSIAEGMSEAAIILGVPEKDIIIEPHSKSTREEAVAVKDIVKNEPFILVTSAIHMKRSMMLFKKLGMNPVPAPSGFCLKRADHGIINLPSLGNIMNVHAALHEYLGILWYKLRGFI